MELAEEPAVSLAQAPTPPILLRDVGFLGPEAALHDQEADVYLVSNSNGGRGEADGNGFISRVSPDGTVLALKWIDGAAGAGLDAPKGMALVGDELFVADLTTLRSFDRKTGQALGKVAIAAAQFLSDVAAAPDGTLYVSDTSLAKPKSKGKSGGEALVLGLQYNEKDAIFRVDAHGVSSVFARGGELGQPTGLLADAGGVWVTSLKGELYRLVTDGKRVASAQLPGAGLQGLIETETGRLALASASTSSVYIGRRPPESGGEGPPVTGGFEPVITDLTLPGDIGYDRGRRQLIVPLVGENALYIQQIPSG
jgi:sugar lactone lactonase YvrE